MTPARRREVAGVIAKANVTLIEDDACGLLDRDSAPLAASIGERTYFLASLSKCLAPGLRVSLVAAPDRTAADMVAGALRATMQMAPPLTTALAIRWLQDGSADAIIAAIRAEAVFRQKLAAKALAGQAYVAHRNGHHLWLPLPLSWSRVEFAGYVQRRGLIVITSDAFSVGGEPVHAIRVSLGAVPSRADLVRGLTILAASLNSSPVAQEIV